MNTIDCQSKLAANCMKRFVDWHDGRTACIPCGEIIKEHAIQVERELVSGFKVAGNWVHWATQKLLSSSQEAYGNRNSHSVLFHTNLNSQTSIVNRLVAALRKRYPFNPTFCTNQHLGYTVEMINDSLGEFRWETYHSIGD